MFKVVQLAALLLACLVLFSTDWSLPWRRLSLRARGIMVFLNATGVGFLFYKVLLTLTHPREWDFLAYYLWSRLAGSDLPIYSPESSQTVLSGLQLPISPTADFLSVVVLVGPNQTPAALLWYRLLIADRSFETAHVIWMVVNIGFLGVCCFLLARCLGKGPPTTVPLLFPVIAFAPVTGTIIFLSQTAFVIMALIAAAWLSLERARAGAFLALGSLLKPIVGLVGLYFLIRRRLKPIIAAIGIGTGSLLLSGLFVGMNEVPKYFKGDFVSRTPLWVFSESINQSLLAVILRFHAPTASSSKPVFDPVFLGVALTLILATVALGWREMPNQNRLVFLHVLTLALLIYPGTLQFYSFFLFLPWLYLASHARREGIPAILLALGLWGGIGLISYSAFTANLATWTALSIILVAERSGFTPRFRLGRHRKASPDSGTVPSSG